MSSTRPANDYYAILGVYPTAESVVIRAAYKALAQRYHPDRFEGPKHVAEARMKELNEAYAVLSDDERREAYDRTRNATGSEGMADDECEAAFSRAAEGLNADWITATEYYPDLDEHRQRLSKFSSTLAFSYQVRMLELKDFPRRKDVANALEADFLRRYFGDNLAIVAFARKLIVCGYRAAARDLNRAVSVLGAVSDAAFVIQRITDKDGPFRDIDLPPSNIAAVRSLIDSIGKFGVPSDIRDLVEAVGGSMTRETVSFKGLLGYPVHEYAISVFGDQFRIPGTGLLEWAEQTLIPRTRKMYSL